MTDILPRKASLALVAFAALTSLSSPALHAQTRPHAAPAAEASRPSAQQADYIVALVNGEPITRNELRARMARAQQQIRERNLAPMNESELRRQVLDVFIGERAQLQLAKEMGITVDQLTLTQAESTVARQNELPSVQALHAALRSEGITVQDFQDDLKRQILLQRLRDRMIEPRVKVSEADIDRFLREQASAQGFQVTPEINLAMILVRVPDGSSEAQIAELRSKADTIAKRAKTEDFAQLASEFSESINMGKDGGVLGMLPVNRYPELFIRSTNALAVGDVTEVIRSDAGFHILKVLERKRGELPPMTVPQTHVRHILLTLSKTQTETDALKRMQDIRRRITTGQADFAAMAREFSQDGSARDGGDLDWANPGQFVPEFEEVMNRLSPGEISEPLRSRFGLHLIQVLERRDHRLTETDQRAIARNMLRESKAAEEFETWAQEVRGRAFVEMRDAPQ